MQFQNNRPQFSDEGELTNKSKMVYAINANPGRQANTSDSPEVNFRFTRSQRQVISPFTVLAFHQKYQIE